MRRFLILVVLLLGVLISVILPLAHDFQLPQRKKVEYTPPQTVITAQNVQMIQKIAQVEMLSWSAGVQFDHDSHYFVFSVEEGALLIDGLTGKEKQYIAPYLFCDHFWLYGCTRLYFGNGYIAAISPDGRLVALTYMIQIWDSETGKLIKSFEPASNDVKFSNNGEWLFFNQLSPSYVGLYAWDIEQDMVTLIDPLLAYGMTSLDNMPLVYVALGGEITFWEPQQGVHPTGITTVGEFAISLDGQYVAAMDSDTQFTLWKLDATPKTVAVVQGDANIIGLTFSFDGEMLAVYTETALVHLWDTQTETELATLDTGFKSPVPLAHWAFSPDGALLALSYDVVQLWDTASGQLVTTLNDLSEYGTVAFSPDGTLLVSSNGDIWGIP